MTAVQTGNYNLLSGEMSYDEIDFAERVGDDDIDIDIDLETGQNDEDYILEDVKSDVSHDEVIISNDDVMIDDENLSYPMDDVDTLHEEHIEMEDAEISNMTATEVSNPRIDTSVQENAPQQPVGFNEASETLTSELDSYEGPLRYKEPEKLPGDQVLIKETEFLDERRVNADSSLSPPIFPTQREPGAQIGADQRIPPSDPGHSSPFGTGSGNEDPTDPVISSGNTAVTEQTQDGLDVKSGKSDTTMQAVERVVVIYQDVEYALCSSSESDDPDTFFLKDTNLVNGSIANLLAELREVIHDDLSSEDELCLAIEDLGIEISETCMSVHDLNFASVIDLHERLLRNDGVVTPGPLYVTLGTKPNFAKRLVNLSGGAAEGKGLSDFVSYDKESEDFEGNTEENGQLGVTDQDVKSSDGSTERPQNDDEGEGGAEEQLPGNEGSVENSGSKTEGASAKEDQDRELPPEDRSQLATSDDISPTVNSRGQGTTNDTHSTTQIAETSDYSKDGVDEDGDLIDYEDEEREQHRESPASVNFGSRDQQNEKNLAPDQHLLPPTHREDEKLVHEEDGDFAGYHEHEEYEGDSVLALEQASEDDVQDGEEFHVPYDGSPEEGEDQNGNVTLDNVAKNAPDSFDFPEPDHLPEIIGTGDDDPGEIDYTITGQESTGIRETNQPIISSVQSEGSKSLAVGRYDQDDDEISYEEVDVPDSNESERTLIADESAPDFSVDETKQAHIDEINYDSDDQQDLNHPTEQKTISEASPVSNSHTSKRQRGDAEDASERASKQAKRTRP